MFQFADKGRREEEEEDFDFSNGTLLLKTILKQYTNEELFH